MNKYYTVLDFDSYLYGAAALLQDSYIKVEHIKSKREKEFKNITEFQGRGNTLGGWLAELNKERNTEFKKEDFEIKSFVRRNNIPISIAKEHIISAIEAIEKKAWCDDLRVVIGGAGNFRMTLDETYKANRPEKPIMYKELREWLINKYKDNIIVAENCEADDVLSIFGWWSYRKALKTGDYTKSNVCLVGIDKDLLQIAGWWYNYNDKLEKPIWITEKQAMRNLCMQLLCGDSTDNIKGLQSLPKWLVSHYQFSGKNVSIGPKTASKLLVGCETVKDYVNKIIFLYKSYFCDIWEEGFQSQYQLIKLQEKKNEIPNINDFIKKGN